MPTSPTTTATLAPGITKMQAAFRALRLCGDSLQEEKLGPLMEAIGLSEWTFTEVLRLNREFRKDAKLRAELEPRILAGELSPKIALETIRARRRQPRKRVFVYRSIYGIAEPPPQGLLAQLARGMGVGICSVMRAIRLKRLLLSDRALFDKWQGKALTSVLSPETILERIEQERAGAAASPQSPA